MNMIERIAIGQAAFDGRKLIEMPRQDRERYRQRARLMLEELMTPTDEMCSAGCCGDTFDIYWEYAVDGRPGGPADVFTAMISKALEGGE